MIKTTGLNKFQDIIREFAKKTKDSPVDIAIMLMLELYRATILKTDVDTGYLIGAWNISVTTKPSFYKNHYDDGKKRKSIKEQVKREQIDRLEPRLNKFNGGILWLANNADYARHREYGTHNSSGAFMLTKAIQSTKARAKQIIKEGF